MRFLPINRPYLAFVAMLLTIPSSMQAQPGFDIQRCHSADKTTGWTPIDGHSQKITIGDWDKFGGSDCEVKNAEFIVRDNGQGAFTSQVQTHFTHGKDVVHIYLELKPAVINEGDLQTFSWDGPKMSEKDRPQFHTWNMSFNFNPNLYHNIKTAKITACC